MVYNHGEKIKYYQSELDGTKINYGDALGTVTKTSDYGYTASLKKFNNQDFFFIVMMKNMSRRRKGKPSLHAYFCKQADFKVTLNQLKELNIINTNIFIVIEIQVDKESSHFTLIVVRFTSENHMRIFFQDSYSSYFYTESIRTILNFGKEYAYKIEMWGFSNCDRIGKIQASALGCFWFALEAVFRLSNVENLFELTAGIKRHRDNIFLYDQDANFFSVRNTPPELASIFISCQSDGLTYKYLPKETREAIIGSRGLNLEETIARRNALGFESFSKHPDIIGHATPAEWPNKSPQHTMPQHLNWSIVYFKIRQLEKIIPWLHVNALLASEVATKCVDIRQWFDLIKRVG